MHLFDIFGHRRRRNQKPEPPSRDGEGLGQRIAGDNPLAPARQRRRRDMRIRGEYDVFIHLVCDDKGVVFLRKREDVGKLFPREYLAARVRRVAHDDCLDALLECGLQRLLVKVKFRRIERNIDGLCPGQDRVRAIVFIKRAKDNHLVARVADGHHRRHHGLGRPAGHDDLAFRVDVIAKAGRILRRDALAQVL